MSWLSRFDSSTIFLTLMEAGWISGAKPKQLSSSDSPASKLCLLDLNYTFTDRQLDDRRPFRQILATETYRKDILEWLDGWTVVLSTARPERFTKETLRRIQEQTGWQPDGAFFNATSLRAWQWKLRVLKQVRADCPWAKILALESNPRTRQMYLGQEVPAISYEEAARLGGHLDQLFLQSR